MKPSIVIPYRRTNTDELKYTLRGLKNISHKDVWVIGDEVSFKVNHIPYRQTSDIARNTLEILNIACNNDEITEDFIWLADDIFILEPMQQIPTWHRGAYDDILSDPKLKTYNYYVNRMIKTNKALKSMGIDKPLCYEIHKPFVINKSKWQQVSRHITKDLNKLSMYGNLNNIGGDYHDDVKSRSGKLIEVSPFLSSHESSFNYSELGSMIRETLNEKGQYEE